MSQDLASSALVVYGSVGWATTGSGTCGDSATLGKLRYRISARLPFMERRVVTDASGPYGMMPSPVRASLVLQLDLCQGISHGEL